MEGHIVLPPLGRTELTLLWAVLTSAFVAMGYGWYLVRRVLAEDPGTKEMQEVARAIEEGAMAYLGRQVRTMSWFVIVMAVGLFFMYYSVPEQYPHPLPIGVSVAFLMGVIASYGAGYVGMWLAVKANLRAANAALKGFKPALELAFRAGTVSGMFTVGFGLLGAVLIFMIFEENAMKVLVGFGFGGSLAALFMRVGGGIFTKAADVGADLVGKVEQNIPEDDPRNAAVIADNVGDNVGDCAGMAADIFESYEVTLVAAIILAAVCTVASDFTAVYGEHTSAFALKLILYPLLIRAVGVFSSIIGTWAVRGKEEELADPMRPITVGYWTASLVSVVGFLIVNYLYLLDPFTGVPDFRFFWATTMGIVLAIVTLWLTNHFTHPDLRPTTETAIAARTGPATLLLSGMAEGLESTVWAAVTIGLTILSSLVIFPDSPALAAYGIALTGLGLLTTTGFILAMDTYGPITDNAHGIFEMSGITEEHEASRNLAWMDAIGNTTKALTKGLAIATAVIAAISLFSSFIDATGLLEKGIQVNLPEVFVGLLIGGGFCITFPGRHFIFSEVGSHNGNNRIAVGNLTLEVHDLGSLTIHNCGTGVFTDNVNITQNQRRLHVEGTFTDNPTIGIQIGSSITIVGHASTPEVDTAYILACIASISTDQHTRFAVSHSLTSGSGLARQLTVDRCDNRLQRLTSKHGVAVCHNRERVGFRILEVFVVGQRILRRNFDIPSQVFHKQLEEVRLIIQKRVLDGHLNI